MFSKSAGKFICPFLVLFGLVAMQGCQARPSARIKDVGEGDLIGRTSAGSATYKRQVEGAVQKLLHDYGQESGGLGKASIAVLGVENLSTEELGDWENQLYQLITNSITSSRQYRAVSRLLLDEGLREINRTQQNLLLPKYQRELAAVLETSGSPIDLLLFPRLTSGSTRGSGGLSQRDYLLTLELIEIQTGNTLTYSEEVSKEYSR